MDCMGAGKQDTANTLASHTCCLPWPLLLLCMLRAGQRLQVLLHQQVSGLAPKADVHSCNEWSLGQHHAMPVL